MLTIRCYVCLIRVFRPGKRELLVKLQGELLNANSHTKARIQQRIDQVQGTLSGF